VVRCVERCCTGAAVSKASKSTLLIVFLTVFIDLLGFGIVLPLLPRYGAYFNASEMQLGLLMASFSAMQFLFAPMWGGLSDRVGRRPILLLGLAGSTFSYGMFGFASSLGRNGLLLGFGPVAWMFIARIGAGIAGATISTAQAVIADCTGAAGRGRGMAMIGAAFGIGFTFGPLIGAISTADEAAIRLNDRQYQLVQSWEPADELISAERFVSEMVSLGDFRKADIAAAEVLLTPSISRTTLKAKLLTPPSALPGYIAAALSFLALLLALIRLQESRPVNASGADSALHRRSWLNVRQLSRYLSQPSLSLILVSIFITTFGFAQFESTLSLLTREFGYGSKWNFLLYAYVGFVLSIGQGMLVRRFLPRIGEHRMALLGVGLMTSGFTAIGLTGSGFFPHSALWGILPIVVIGFSAVTPSLQSLLSQAASSDEQGAVLGTGQSLSSLARILGPYVGIQLLAVSTATPYFLGAGLILSGGFLISRIRREASAASGRSL
jgi:DHA1 family tetracycline resistance protein-like MFS transporter